ncbi:hypothetical protein A7X67_01565 [Clostridium sp. W14A]|nr:hypothetical protein A7X67_01565 [Clostridium sp. W14A]
MKITDVKIRLLHSGDPIRNWDPRVRAIAGVRLDDKFYLNDIKICQTSERFCIEFPPNPYSANSGHPEYTVVPVSMKARRWIEAAILAEYAKKVQAKRSAI